MKQSSVGKRIRKLRAQYRKRMAIVAVIALVVGMVLGVIVDQKLINRKDAPTVVVLPEVTATPDPEPTEVPEAPETEAPEATPEAPEATEPPEDEGGEIEDNGDTDEGGDEAPAGDEGDEGDDKESYTIAMEAPTMTPVPTATPEPTPTVEPTPAPGPTVLAVVPFGESYSFDAQITPDGYARYKIEEGEPFETLRFTLTMREYLLPSDYATRWGTKYKLKGTEAGAGFDLTLGDYTGTATIIPQNILTVVLQSESGDTKNPGFQMTDAEINGQTNVDIRSNATKTFWKRYTFSNAGEPMEYLSVSACVNGAVQTVLFELKSDIVPTPDPQELYTTLTRGDKSDAVLDLQKRLIDLGYLSGTADGNYGEKTQNAVRAAQKYFGMEENGTATPDFQARLYATPEEIAAAEATPEPTAEPTAEPEANDAGEASTEATEAPEADGGATVG